MRVPRMRTKAVWMSMRLRVPSMRSEAEVSKTSPKAVWMILAR
jgi:hypothetical protein